MQWINKEGSSPSLSYAHVYQIQVDQLLTDNSYSVRVLLIEPGLFGLESIFKPLAWDE